MNDALLVRVLDGLTDADQQLDALARTRRSLSQYSVIGNAVHEFHHEIRAAGLGRARVVDTAMPGWSITASACRSASKRATNCLVSMPSLSIFNATRRAIGAVCSAM